MAGAERRMPPNQLGRIDRMHLLLHSERNHGSERIFEVPFVAPEFGIERHPAKVFHIRV